MKVLGMNCPHCGSRAQVRTSKEVSRTMREVYFQCVNLACGHTWAASLEANRTISPSAVPSPEVDLPIVERGFAETLFQSIADENDYQRSLFDEYDI